VADSTIVQDSTATDSAPESGTLDAGMDAATPDAPGDSGAGEDSGLPDAGGLDAPVSDSAVLDTGHAGDAAADTGVDDSAPADTGAVADTGPPDSAPTDATLPTDATADGGPRDASSDSTATYTIGGQVSGLAGGDSLSIEVNGSGTTFVSANGSFTLPTLFPAGATYSVTIAANPALPVAETCTVSAGAGTVGSANVTSVTIACVVPTPTVPPAATAAGYTINSYHVGPFTSMVANPTTGNTDDGCRSTGGTYNGHGTSGQLVYCFNFFGYSPRPASPVPPSGYGYNVQVNTLDPSNPQPPNLAATTAAGPTGTDGSLTTWADTNNNGAVMASAGAKGGSYVGVAFGCGAYIESIAAIPPLTDLTPGHPAAWSMALEHLAGLSGAASPTEQWAGQATGYVHFIEADYGEFFGINASGASLLNTAPIDWYGKPGCGSDGFCKDSPAPAIVATPGGSNLSVYHRYGLLWVPATAAVNGHYQAYFDDAPIGQNFSWTQDLNSSALAPTPTAAFTGSVSGGMLNVTALASTGGGSSGGTYAISFGAVGVGQVLSGTGVPTGAGAPTITGQVSGTPGGIGVYSLSNTGFSVASEALAGTSPWTFGIVDYDHLVLIWGGAANAPITVLSTDVWQSTATEACNLTR